MESDKFFTDHNQFSVSHELVLLLEWIMTHKRDQIKTLIKKSVSQGLAEHINNEAKDSVLDSNFLYYTIIDFFDTLETFLNDAIEDEMKRQVSQNKILKTIQNFDATTIDKTTIQASLEKVVKQMASKEDMTSKDTLLKEVLLRWKPVKHETKSN